MIGSQYNTSVNGDNLQVKPQIFHPAFALVGTLAPCEAMSATYPAETFEIQTYIITPDSWITMHNPLLDDQRNASFHKILSITDGSIVLRSSGSGRCRRAQP